MTLCEKMAQFDAKKYAEFQASVGAAPAKKAEKKAEKKPEEKKAPAPKKEKPKKEEDDEEGFMVQTCLIIEWSFTQVIGLSQNIWLVTKWRITYLE